MSKTEANELRMRLQRRLHAVGEARLAAIRAMLCGDTAQALRWLDEMTAELDEAKRQACAWASMATTELVKR